MQKMYRMTILIMLVTLVASCTAPTVIDKPAPSVLPNIQIARHPEPVNYSWLNIHTEPPTYDPNSTSPWQVDLRSSNLTHLDLSRSGEDLFYADFDSNTKWPPSDKMPENFNWQEIMEAGKDPGLGLRDLHKQGITGRGVGIAIIDQTLLVDHVEYKDRIRVYEEGDDITGGWLQVQMHGPAVASIAVGKTVGVAPEADLYYIATGDCGATSNKDFDFSCEAQAVRRIIEINKSLPVDRKIRVLSMSIGWSKQNMGYKEIMSAVKEATTAGIFVISSSLGLTNKLYFQGLGREPLDDPNQFDSYIPGLWWEKDYFADPSSYYFGNPPEPLLLVPMDSRTTASPTGVEDYVFYRVGGWSWSIPYLAGMYALAVQVDPDITPKEFWETALETGRTIPIQHGGKEYEFGVILDPSALIKAVKSQ